MPRLTPRRPRRFDGGDDEENSLFNTELTGLSFSSDLASSPGPPKKRLDDSNVPSPRPPPLQHHNPKLYQRRVLADKAATSEPNSKNHPLSPCPTSIDQEIRMDLIKSPLSSDILLSDTSFSDCSITPPATRPRPLVVSAKRVGQDVRRQHSKRRRPSRRVTKHGDNNGFCLWKDQNAPTPSYASSDDEDDCHDLPFLFDSNSVSSESEQKKQYWEWCYGKETNVHLNATGSFSAQRAPPTKGWYVSFSLFVLSCVKRPTCNLTPTFFVFSLRHKVKSSASISSYKTPPASPLKKRKSRSGRPKKNVQFGLPQAAEYDIDQPSGQLTPMPSDVTKQRYSMDIKEQTKVEEEMTQETKQNSILLAEWEEEFEEPRSSSRRRRKNRRSSALFTPSPNLKSDRDDNDERNLDQTTLMLDSALEAQSPSVQVAETLASLTMASPASTSESAAKPLTRELTAEFEVDLNQINSSGGAMDITPPQTNQSAGQEITPPPSSVSLESIHTVGGALDLESPASVKQSSSISPTLSSIIKYSEKGGIEQSPKVIQSSVVPVDIIKNLLERPLEDQEWNLSDVFLNFSKASSNARGLEALLKHIDSRQDGVIACMDDLMHQAKYLSVSKPKIAAMSEKEARKCAIQEWKELETRLMKDLTKVLGTTLGKAAAVSQRSKIIDLPESTQKVKAKCLPNSIEREIKGLEQAIGKEQKQIQYLEALNAPYSALHCQTAFGISGFRLDEYTGDKFQLSFEHVVDGIESRFVFDLTNGDSTASCQNITSNHQHPIPSDHISAKYHSYFLQQLVNGNIPLLKELQLDDLQESILVLSRWLGNLDLSTAALYHATNKFSEKVVSIEADMPVMNIKFNEDERIRMTFDQTQNFIPQGYHLCQEGDTEVWNEMPSGVTSTNYFAKVIQDYLD